MTPTQAAILARLEEAREGGVVSFSALIEAVGREISNEQLRVQITGLRHEVAASGRLIVPVHSRGYRLIQGR